MLAALPLIVFTLTFLHFASTDAWRTSYIKATVVLGLLVVANTEILSLVRLLSLPAVAVTWGVECLLAAFATWQRRGALAERIRAVRSTSIPLSTVFALVPVILILAAVGLTAWVAPPNTYDSMTYHMSRVAHWIADRTIDYYPTNIVRQLDQPPLAEYAVMQLQILSSSDQFANLVQWFSMTGCVVGASLIAQQLGSQVRGQFLAAIVVATLPMAILQASSTQTDLVEAVWLACAFSMALSFVSHNTLQSAAWFAASLGLAALTKGTGYIFAAPLVIAVACWLVVKLRRRLVVPALLMLVIPLLINSGHYVRNQALFNSPIAQPSDSQALVNDVFTPQSVMSNVIRDGVLQFGTPSGSLNNVFQQAIVRIHSQVLHIGVNDPRTTWSGTTFGVNALSFDEDYAGDPLQAMLAVAAVVAALAIAFRRGHPLLAVYAGALVVAFVIFAGYLKWQPWSSRLELPLMVLAAPLIGVTFSRISSIAITTALGVMLIVAAVPWVIDNESRPLVGYRVPRTAAYLPQGANIFTTPRIDLYFAKRHELEAPYSSVAARAQAIACTEIALWSGPDDWEYPLWVLTDRLNGTSRIDQVMVVNESIRASSFGTAPCLLVAVVPNQPPTVDVGGVEFTQTASQNGVGSYEPSKPLN
jgi:hypothetical protein